MGDTAMTPDQGGVGGSTSIMAGAKPLRNAAATARYLLLQLASRTLGVPAEQLEVQDGIISVKGDAVRKTSLTPISPAARSERRSQSFRRRLRSQRRGRGKPKDPSHVHGGRTIRFRASTSRPKFSGNWQYVDDVRVPGMLHGRVIRPAGVGASSRERRRSSPSKQIPGYVKTVVKGNFVGVVARKRMGRAFKPHKALKVTWIAPEAAFPEQRIFTSTCARSTPKASKETVKTGDAAAALAGAAKKVEASYEFPFQSHATMGPGCAVADVHIDGVTTVWSGAQKPHDLQKGFAELLGVPLDQVRVDLGGRCRLLRPPGISRTPPPMPFCFRKQLENPCACSGCAPT